MDIIKEIAGFIIRRRCEECGRRITDVREIGNGALLKCECGKEYVFRVDAGLYPVHV